MSAQTTIVKGDMNGDNELTIADAVSVVDVILGKSPKEEISVGGDPYAVDNTLVVGTWYAPDGTSFTLNADGATNYTGAATYKFRPQLGTLLFFDASGKPVKKIVVDEVEQGRYQLSVNSATGDYTYYTHSVSLVSGLTMSKSTLTLNSGATAQLSVTATPPDALNPSVVWTSSNESVATVDASGLVRAWQEAPAPSPPPPPTVAASALPVRCSWVQICIIRMTTSTSAFLPARCGLLVT